LVEGVAAAHNFTFLAASSIKNCTKRSHVEKEMVEKIL
jgi:hypothetical protein